MTYTVGLTGGVASGKSYVETLFERLGVPVLDADQASRAVVEPGSPVLDAITARFGAGVLRQDGTLDRRALRSIIFADASARRDLEALTHPAIREHIRAWRAAQRAPYCMLANAILIESGMHASVDRVLVVDAPVDCQIRRLLARDGITETDAGAMIAAQANRAQRLALAQDVIDNADETSDLGAAVARLNRLYLRLATAAHTAPSEA